MELEQLRAYLLNKIGAYEDFPFGPKAMIFKVMGKMFALVAWLENPLWINLKCDPDLAMHLRNIYKGVRPGYHMNKKHWNTIVLDDAIASEEIFSMIDESYDLVAAGLKKVDRDRLEQMKLSLSVPLHKPFSYP